MAEEKRGPQEQAAQAEEERPKRPLQRLLEALGAGHAQEQPPQPTGQVIAPVQIEKLLDVLMETTVREEEAAKPSPVQTRVKELTAVVQKLARSFINVYLSDGLGRIYHPMYSVPVVESRLAILSQLLSATVKEIWRDVAKVIKNHTLPPDEAANFIKEAYLATRLAFLVIPEVYSQLLTLYYVNAPPELRPPLVNAALGYEIVGGSVARRRR